MEIPLKAQVECTDGICGRSVYIVIDPVTEKVTHLVVRMTDAPNTEYVVPLDRVATTIDNVIHLHSSKADLAEMKTFTQTEFIEETVPGNSYGYGGGQYGMGAYYYLPYVTPDQTVLTPVEHQQIPPGELAVRRGTHVNATDGPVGKVDEFVINPANGQITYLVMREGHLWGQKHVIIPMSELADIREDTVFLKLDKQAVEALPTFPVHRPCN